MMKGPSQKVKLQFYIKTTFLKVFIAELKQLLFKIGKDDLKARQPPRTYGIWTTLPSKWTNWRALLFKKSHHDRIECESQHPYVCQRPAAALESSESLAWKGCYSESFIGDTSPTLRSDLMTIDLSSETPTPEKNLIKSSRIVSRDFH